MTDEERSVADGIAEVEEQMTALARRIRATSREAAAAIHPELPPIGYKMLRVIRRCGTAHASAVADQLGVDRSVVSRQLRQLQELGLVEVRSDAQDGRARVLALTELGAAGLETDETQGGSRLMRLLGGWTRDDLDAFAGYLARLNEGVDPIGSDPVSVAERSPAHAG